MARSSREACAVAEAGATRSASIGARAALLPIRGYKVALSPYFRGSCRFLPSCADYASQAIAVHGLIRGGWLAARRLARCHPLCASGYDPVPGVGTNFTAESVPGLASPSAVPQRTIVVESLGVTPIRFDTTEPGTVAPGKFVPTPLN